MPYFLKALQADDYTITEQMRASPTYTYFMDRGLYPIYHPKSVAGLTLYDRDGQKLYAASYPNHVFTDFSGIPPLLVNTLLFIENRELLQGGPVTRNPVIEWNRFFYAVFGHLAHPFVPGLNAGGGSTLATQIEKFRFSPGGETNSGIEKLRQIMSASLRVYLDGQDTQQGARGDRAGLFQQHAAQRNGRDSARSTASATGCGHGSASILTTPSPRLTCRKAIRIPCV